MVKTVPVPDTGDSVVSGALDPREPSAPSVGPRVSVVTVALPARDAGPGLGLDVACGNRTMEDGKRSREGPRGGREEAWHVGLALRTRLLWLLSGLSSFLTRGWESTTQN